MADRDRHCINAADQRNNQERKIAMRKEETKVEYTMRRIEEETKAGNDKQADSLRETLDVMLDIEEEMKQHAATLLEIFINDIARSLMSNLEYKSFKIEYRGDKEYLTGWENSIDDFGEMERLEIEVTGYAVPEMAEHIVNTIIGGRWKRYD